jgi:protein-tyrosine phosphatase
MIDLHCHILPGIDDGAKTLDMSLEMARIAVADGITTLACTPHIYPGMYMNDGPGIAAARDALQAELNRAGIALQLVVGADVHLVPGLLDGLKSGRIPTLNGSRYLLLEPSHTTPPPRFEESVFNLIASGYTPVITHPERLTWVEGHFSMFGRLIQQGAWMQVTAGALTGVFGPRAKYWGERFVGEGMTHVLATDAHSTGRRLPRLSDGLAVVARLVGDVEARRMVLDRPQSILENLPPPPLEPVARVASPPSLLGKWLSRLRQRD